MIAIYEHTETPKKILEDIDKNAIDIPVGIDRAGNLTCKSYDAKGAPAMYLIDKKGILRCRPTEGNLEEWIKQLREEN